MCIQDAPNRYIPISKRKTISRRSLLLKINATLPNAIQCPLPSLNNAINPLRNQIAQQAEPNEPAGDAEEPIQVFNVLAGDDAVHTPYTSNDVHGKDDGTEDGQLAEDVRCLLLALVHANVDLSEVVAVGAGEEAVGVSLIRAERKGSS